MVLEVSLEDCLEENKRSHWIPREFLKQEKFGKKSLLECSGSGL